MGAAYSSFVLAYILGHLHSCFFSFIGTESCTPTVVHSSKGIGQVQPGFLIFFLVMCNGSHIYMPDSICSLLSYISNFSRKACVGTV